MGLDELNSKYDDILVMGHISSEVDFKTSFTNYSNMKHLQNV